MYLFGPVTADRLSWSFLFL